ncbi:MAG: VCBS repeat-containing protein [Verrucomicrobiales bacterium]|nr:VCBS repeat-containing protein [Verrucomicrobiales bacterium]
MLVLALVIAGCHRNESDTASKQDTAASALSDQFLSLMIAGKNHLSQGDTTNALLTYQKAQAIVPHDSDLHLNLANCYLLNGESVEAIREAEEALKLEPNSAAAYFIKGSAFLRLSNAEEAAKALENVKKIDPGETSTFFQLGMARMGLKQWDEAISAFREGLRMDPNRLHAGARYQLAQALLRAGRQAEAQQELQHHLASTDGGGPAVSAATFERSKYTQARVPFRLDQPDARGIPQKFVDATAETLGANARDFRGPIGVIRLDRTTESSLFVRDGSGGFRVLRNTKGSFRPTASPAPNELPATGSFSKILVGDLQNDRYDDIIVLGEHGSRVFRLATNGLIADVSASSGLSTLKAKDGLLIDLDFTGKLDLAAVSEPSREVVIYRQFGPLAFSDITRTSGIPASLKSAHALAMSDWNRDEIQDLIASRTTAPPLLLEKQRGGPLVAREIERWAPGSIVCAGDFDNDLRPDLAVVSSNTLQLCFNRGERQEFPLGPTGGIRQIVALDHDNDGWLDLWMVGDRLRAWRNGGLSGFREQSVELGLNRFEAGSVAEVHFADFDGDCDSDVVVGLVAGGIRYLRNEGGNANAQVKVQMIGNRSNASGIGCKIEIETGGLRLLRTVHSLPVEVGVGKTQKLDSFLVHWFNWPQGSAELNFNCHEPLFALELTIQEGSCPYLYAWNGNRFEFVTDILGASPLGLPVAEGRYIEPDPEELVWVGNEQSFPPRDGHHEVRITEELREVLYLDEARLVVVDREPTTEVHVTDKLLPGKPYPSGEFLTLHQERPLHRAELEGGRDVTSALKSVDGQRVSPPRLRPPQLRGLAEPHPLTLDFGVLDASRPLVLVLNGWLRFGGGMANIAASHDPSLPFPFPSLEAELANGNWKPVDVVVGAPAGKTKTILVDLEGKLTPGTRRLRLTGAFEIHWDRIALMEKKSAAETRLSYVSPNTADLRFRGFSQLRDLPSDWPLTPDYEQVSPNFYWTLTPGGWCTRYGDVLELVARRDEGLALINAGDELSLRFSVSSLPAKPPGQVREFFLYVDGWDKDSDFHVATGTQVEPLPFHGMNGQLIGREKRPSFPSDELHRTYNTRWVEGRVLKQIAKQAPAASR